ncbi:unnamed protein product, partial [Tenebrio molitor]
HGPDGHHGPHGCHGPQGHHGPHGHHGAHGHHGSHGHHGHHGHHSHGMHIAGNVHERRMEQYHGPPAPSASPCGVEHQAVPSPRPNRGGRHERQCNCCR